KGIAVQAGEVREYRDRRAAGRSGVRERRAQRVLRQRRRHGRRDQRRLRGVQAVHRLDGAQRVHGRGDGVARRPHWMLPASSKIGKYMSTTMKPITRPITVIMAGSMRRVATSTK